MNTVPCGDFYSSKDWYGLAQNWKKTAEALAIALGKIEYAETVYEDISNGLSDRVRERIAINKSTQDKSDSIHDYVELISKEALMAEQNKDLAEADGTSDYYYWQGYIEALDCAIDLVPSYNDSLQTEFLNDVQEG